MNPSHIAIRNAASVFVLAVMIITLGVWAYVTLPREAAPDIQIPLLIVTIPFPGASPEDVEALVTRKAELALQNVDNLKSIQSTSAEGVASIRLEFYQGFNVDEARTKVREKLDEVRPDLPTDIEDPIISEINFSEQPMMIVSLSGEVGLVVLKDVAEDLKEDLQAIPGILEVDRVGGLEREVQVYVHPDKLRYYHVSLNQVASAVERENTNIPGGTIEMGPTKYLIRVPGEFKRPEEVNDFVVAAPNQAPIFVKDVARVLFGFKDLTSRSRLDGKESVSLVIIKRSGENLLEIRGKIRSVLAQYSRKYAGRITFHIQADMGKFVQRINKDLENNIISGFILVFGVLLVAMGFRNALFVATAIPMSFLLTLIGMQWLGFTLNFVVLFSLILSLGMLVDDAIVVVENIYRHVQSGKPPVQAAMQGISEVAIPVTTSTLTNLAAFVPIIFMPGISGQFMSYLPETLIFALSASLFMSLIINPVLCATLMRTQRGNRAAGDELALVEHSRILRAYRVVLRFALRHRALVLAGTVVLFFVIMVAYGATTLKRKGVEFFPSSEPDTANITIEAPTGSTLAQSDRYTHEVEQRIAPERPYITAMVSNIGQRRGFGGAQGSSATSHLSYITLEFPEWEDWKRKPSAVVEDIRKEVKGVVGADVKLNQAEMGPPTGPPVNIELHGQDFARMLPVAESIKDRIRDIPGLINLGDDFDRSRPELRVIVDREKAARLGLTTQDIAFTVRTAFNGRQVSTYRLGKDDYDVTVRLDDPYRTNPMDLARLQMTTPSGAQVPLSEVATIDTGPSYGSIRHIKLDRVITISADAAHGVAGPLLLAKAQARLAGFNLPDGMSLAFTGENEQREEAQTFLFKSFWIALFLIFLVLVTQFNSLVTPFIIMSTVILSLMGVFLGLMIHDLPFSVMMSGIGVISLAGIVVKNAIVLIDFIHQLRDRGYVGNEAIVLAGMVRLRPVFLTAATTVLGLLPIAIGMDIDFFRWPRVVVFGAAGGSFWLPMALSVIYGLSVATVLTLVIVPVLYSSTESARDFLGRQVGRLTGHGRLAAEDEGTEAAPDAAADPGPPGRVAYRAGPDTAD